MESLKRFQLKPFTRSEFQAFALKCRNYIGTCHSPEAVVRLVKTIELMESRGKSIPNDISEDVEGEANAEVSSLISANDPNDIIISGFIDFQYPIRILKFYTNRLSKVESPERKLKIEFLKRAINILENTPPPKPIYDAPKHRDILISKGFDPDCIVRWTFPRKPKWAEFETINLRSAVLSEFTRLRLQLGISNFIASYALSIQAPGAYNTIIGFHRFGKRRNYILPDAIQPLIELLYGNSLPDWTKIPKAPGSRNNINRFIRARGMAAEFDKLRYKRGLSRDTIRKILSQLTGLTDSGIRREISRYRTMKSQVKFSRESEETSDPKMPNRPITMMRFYYDKGYTANLRGDKKLSNPYHSRTRSGQSGALNAGRFRYWNIGWDDASRSIRKTNLNSNRREN